MLVSRKECFCTERNTLWDLIKDKYPNLVFSRYADVTISLDKGALTLSWKTDLGGTGNCVLPPSKAGEPSKLNATKSDWGDFKKYVSGLSGKRFLFRGQKDARRLRTSFHRTNDRAAFLRLAETLTAFLARLRSAAETLSVTERQRIDGSSSAAPVIMPGPSDFKSNRIHRTGANVGTKELECVSFLRIRARIRSQSYTAHAAVKN